MAPRLLQLERKERKRRACQPLHLPLLFSHTFRQVRSHSPAKRRTKGSFSSPEPDYDHYHHVRGTYELLEQILHSIDDPRDIFVIQHVCKTWQANIKSPTSSSATCSGSLPLKSVSPLCVVGWVAGALVYR